MAFKNFTRAKKKALVITVLAVLVLACLVAAILVWQLVDWNKKDREEEDRGESTEDDYYYEESDSVLGKYSHGAVSTDSPYCAKIGKDILEKNGSAADAAIAAAICVGLIQTQSMGLGGGFLAVHYSAAAGKAESLIAREKAPGAAHRDMFHGDPKLSSRGPLSAAVPGELKGYWELYKKHGGKVLWKDLFSPTIKLAEEGFNVSYHAANALRSNRITIMNTPALREVFLNPNTSQLYREGELMKRPRLAQTLRTIANAEGEKDILYQNTTLMRELVDDLRKEGGIITEQDMLNFNVEWEDAIKVNVSGGYTAYSVPPPGSGILLALVFRILEHFDITSETLTSYQQIVEAFKHAYAKRTLLGDPNDPDVREEVAQLRRNLTESKEYLESVLSLIHDNSTSNDHEYYGAEFYQPEDHGTSHLSVIAPNGDAVAITSTVNLYFGSMVRSPRTGIIFNDQMDDFSSPNVTNAFGVPPSKNNFIVPNKRPVSSMVPAIFTDRNGKVRLVIGAAGGTKITTSVVMTAIRNLWFGEDIKRAIDARRIHHQLYPMEVQYEEGFNPKFVEGLQNIGHGTDQFSVGTSVVTAVAVGENGTIYANADFRKRGTQDGF